MFRFAVALSLVALAGCATTIGPFVADIKPAGDGRVFVQRCTFTQSAWDGSVSPGRCDSELLDLHAAPVVAPQAAPVVPQPAPAIQQPAPERPTRYEVRDF